MLDEDRHQLEALDPSLTVLEEIGTVALEAPTGRLRAILGSFLFSGDSVDKRVWVLSGGEKARLALAKMLVKLEARSLTLNGVTPDVPGPLGYPPESWGPLGYIQRSPRRTARPCQSGC